MFYFGEVQYDLLDPENVLPFNPLEPEEHLDSSAQPDPNLLVALGRALLRSSELKQPGM